MIRMAKEKMCACGKPLHYANKSMEKIAQRIVDEQGEEIKIVVEGRSWMVPRHFIALHGIEAAELPSMGFREVTNGDL